MTWSDEEVLAAVRRRLATRAPYSSWDFVGAELVDRAVRVVLVQRRGTRLSRARYEASVFAVDYTLIDLPEGANTGTECETPDRWAAEVAWDIDEEVDTGGLWRAARSIGPDTVVRLRWQRWVVSEP